MACPHRHALLPEGPVEKRTNLFLEFNLKQFLEWCEDLKEEDVTVVSSSKQGISGKIVITNYEMLPKVHFQLENSILFLPYSLK